MTTRVVPPVPVLEPLLDKTAAAVQALPPAPPGGPPVYTWDVPNRQCVGRLNALQCFVMSDDESIQFSMDFAFVLALNGAKIATLNSVIAYDEDGNPTSFIGNVDASNIDGSEIVFGIGIPDGTADGDFTVIVQIIDSEGNQYNGCGCLRVRSC